LSIAAKTGSGHALLWLLSHDGDIRSDYRHKRGEVQVQHGIPSPYQLPSGQICFLLLML
jgi:hypothetical protein